MQLFYQKQDQIHHYIMVMLGIVSLVQQNTVFMSKMSVENMPAHFVVNQKKGNSYGI